MKQGIFYVQGGGTVKWCKLQQWYIFVTVPDWGDFKIGDVMPLEWSIA